MKGAQTSHFLRPRGIEDWYSMVRRRRPVLDSYHLFAMQHYTAGVGSRLRANNRNVLSPIRSGDQKKLSWMMMVSPGVTIRLAPRRSMRLLSVEFWRWTMTLRLFARGV